MPAADSLFYLRTLATVALVEACAEQTQLFFKKKPFEPLFCMELFRRALLRQDDEAWGGVMRNYRGHMFGWARARAGGRPVPGELADDLIQGAWMRFMRAFTAEHYMKAAEIGTILNYLRSCVNSETLDLIEKYPELFGPRYASPSDPREEAPEPSGNADDIEKQAQLALVLAHLQSLCKSPKERTVFELCLLRDCPPRDVLAMTPDTFSSIDDVNQTVRNLRDRIRRDPQMRGMLKDLL